MVEGEKINGRPEQACFRRSGKEAEGYMRESSASERLHLRQGGGRSCIRRFVLRRE